MELDFNVKTHREWSDTVKITPEIEAVVSRMGCVLMDNRALGAVVAVAKKTGGVVSKSELKWDADNDRLFDSSLAADAAKLLELVTGAIKISGGGDDEVKVKVVTKM